MDWDWVVSALIIIGLILAIWSRLTQQTIKELLTDIRDFIVESKEEASERGELLDLKVLDSIIFNKKEFYSLNNEN